MEVEWRKCRDDKWCSLNYVILEERHERGGVYIIWHGGNNPAVVYIGQTNDIKGRLEDHRSNNIIQKYEVHGLYVTWAYVDGEDTRKRIEADLWSYYAVKEGLKQTHAYPIAVSKPF